MEFYLFKDTSQPSATVRMSSLEPIPYVIGRRMTLVAVPSGAPLFSLLAQLKSIEAELRGITGDETYIKVTMAPVDPVPAP